MSIIRHRPAANTSTVILAGGATDEAHHHDEHQILYASSGVLSVTTDAGVWVAPATRALWVPAGTVHQHRAHGHTVMHTIGLPVTANPLRTHTPTVVAVSALLREVLIAYAKPPHTPTPQRQRLLAVLLDQLDASPERPLHVPTPRDSRLLALATLLSDTELGACSLHQLAHRVGSSARTLSRLCRDELGMTFPQWRTQLRLHHALQLLAEGTPVTAVAHLCGWATSSAFINVFRRTLGYTPGGRSLRAAARDATAWDFSGILPASWHPGDHDDVQTQLRA